MKNVISVVAGLVIAVMAEVTRSGTLEQVRVRGVLNCILSNDVLGVFRI